MFFNFATRARRFMRETTREALRCKASRKTNPVPLNVACCRTWNRCRIERPFLKRIFVEFVPQFRRQTGKRWKFVTEAVSFKKRTRSEYCTTVCNEHRQHPHHVQPPQLLACTTYSETVSRMIRSEEICFQNHQGAFCHFRCATPYCIVAHAQTLLRLEIQKHIKLCQTEQPCRPWKLRRSLSALTLCQR
jgi:hypothetical protein